MRYFRDLKLCNITQGYACHVYRTLEVRGSTPLGSTSDFIGIRENAAFIK